MRKLAPCARLAVLSLAITLALPGIAEEGGDADSSAATSKAAVDATGDDALEPETKVRLKPTARRAKESPEEKEERRRIRKMRRTRRRERLAPPVVESSYEFEMLKQLGYVDGTIDEHAENSGVLLHEEDRVLAGYNFLTSPVHNGAVLMDMEGRWVHRWSDDGGRWSYAELLPDSSVLGIEKSKRIVKLSSDSELLWEREGNFHHAIWVHSNGDIYTLERKTGAQVIPLYEGVEVHASVVTILGPDGTRKGEIPILPLLARSQIAFLLPNLTPTDLGPYDVMHMNQVEVFDGRLAHLGPLYKKGNLLLSLRNLNLILIVKAESHEVLWAWGPYNLTHQHHPSLLESGRILVFDNGKTHSRVLEIDPRNNHVEWVYADEEFFTETRGSAMRLKNGNTLITESDSGYAFEVTPEGETVWEFANPDFVKDNMRAVLGRVTRVPEASLDFLQR